MAQSRYRRIKNLKTTDVHEEVHEKLLEDRGIDRIRFYPAQTMRAIRGQKFRNLKTVSHTWKLGDRYWKLAAEHYGDPGYWWVIAKFNYRPTESHVKAGDKLLIPTQLSDVLSHYNI
jgi:nucleoid-associated protein YgaU